MLKLSASSIGTFDKCKKKYYYTYINKPEIEKKQWVHLEFGTCAHKALELFHLHIKNNIVKPEEYGLIMKDSFKKAMAEANKELLKPEMGNLYKVLQDYLNKIKKDGIPHVIGVEEEFNFKINDIVVRGYIDRIDLIDEGVYHVVDYKTSSSSKYLTNFQLGLYGIALQEKYEGIKEIRGSYCLLKLDSQLKSWVFSENDLKEIRNKIIETGTSINIEKDWKKSYSKLCEWCDFNSICLDNFSANNSWV